MIEGNLVSIIVPMYNVQNTIQDSIDSVISQKYPLWELILIDDGSKDKTGEICRRFVKSDKRIQYFKQENNGVSSARNYGLKCVKGKYIMFLDADDKLADNAIENLISCTDENNADIVVGGYNNVENIEGYKVLDKSKAISAALIGNETMKNINMGSPWAKLFSRKLIADAQITFNENISHREDLLFNITAYANSTSIVLLDKVVYYYTINNGESLVRRFNDKKIEELGNLLLEMERFNNNIYTLEDSIMKRFAMQTVYTGWSDYYTHINNRQSFSKDLKIMKESLLSNKLHQYWDKDNLKQEAGCSKYQKLIMTLMYNKMYSLLEIISVVVRTIKRCL